MKLSAFLAQREIKPSEFARQINVSASTITRLLRGERGPSLDLALLIQERTGGEVTVQDFASPEPPMKVADAQPDPTPEPAL